MTVYYHKELDTMDIWFGAPNDEYICDEAGEGVIFKKNRDCTIIGIEKLYVSKTAGLTGKPVPLKLIVA